MSLKETRLASHVACYLPSTDLLTLDAQFAYKVRYKSVSGSGSLFEGLQNGCNKVVIELRAVQIWSEITVVISNDFEITRMIQTKLHSTLFNYRDLFHHIIVDVVPDWGEIYYGTNPGQIGPPMWPGYGSGPVYRIKWVEFVVGSLSCSEGFTPGSPVFLPPQKQYFHILFRPG